MTDYERTTVRESSTVEPAAPVAGGPYAVAEPPVAASAVRTTERTSVPAGPSTMSVLIRVVTFAFGVLQAALILRIVLLLLVANPGNDIVAAVLTVTDPFVEPFRGMFSLDAVTADQGSVLDIAAIVALIAWTLIEVLIIALLRIFDRREVTTA